MQHSHIWLKLIKNIEDRMSQKKKKENGEDMISAIDRSYT